MAPASVDEVIESCVVVAATERARVAFAVCAVELESFTVTPMGKLPLDAGVPEIIPVPAPRLNPAGRLPEEIAQL